MWEDGREGRAGGGSEAYTQGFVDDGFFTYAVATGMLRKCAGYTKNFQCGIAVSGADSSTLQLLASTGSVQLEVPTSDHSRATDHFFRMGILGGQDAGKGFLSPRGFVRGARVPRLGLLVWLWCLALKHECGRRVAG